MQVCDQESKRRLLGTVMMLGLMIGSLIGGRLSDKFGRKKVMICASLLIMPLVTFGGYSPNYACYLILHLIYCSALPIVWICTHSITVEIFDPHYRKIVVIVKDLVWPIGQLILTFTVYNVRNWTKLHLVVGAMGLLGLPSFFIVPESPRWLANNKRKEDAEKVFLTIAKWNKRLELSLKQRELIRNILNKIEQEAHEVTETNLNIINMFKKDNLSKTLIIQLNWITMCIGSYTLMLNGTKLSGDIFINFALLALFDIPGIFVLMATLKFFGRKFNLFYTQMILGICCLILAFLPQTSTKIILVFYLIGKSAAGTGFTLVWLVTAEIFPTNLRSQAIGFCSMVSRIFSLVCPFVATLAIYWGPLPMLVLGVPCLFSGLLVYFLPETKGRELPQNMKDTQEPEL